MSRSRILLTHTPDMRANYYGPRALSGLQALGEVVTHEGSNPLSAAEIIRLAKGCQLIVSDRNTPGHSEIFAAIPDTIAFLRCAVDIRTIDVDAASEAGVLITQASPGFVASVAEMAFGMMIDLARDVTRHATDYRAGLNPQPRKGVQLSGATIGLLGYGATLGGNEDKYSLQPEFSVGYLISKNVVIGAEYRFMRNKLETAGNVAFGAGSGALRAQDWKDIFIAWAPSKNVSLTLAYVDLGVIVPATSGNRKQTGYYLSAQLAF